MEHATGAILQETMRTNPAVEEVQTGFLGMVEGIIRAGGVFPPGSPQNTTNQTLVSVTLLNGHPDINFVPLLAPKANRSNGQYSDPEGGDRVLIGFIGGNFIKPIVIGFLNMPRNSLQANSADAPVYHHHHQGTDTVIDSQGSRVVRVAKNETVTIVGDGTVSIGGNLQISIVGDAIIKSTGGTITLDTSVTRCTGDLRVDGNISVGGDVTDKVRSMADDRTLYDLHVHSSAAPGEQTSPPTTPE